MQCFLLGFGFKCIILSQFLEFYLLKHTGSLFYLTTITCNFAPQLNRACGLSAEWAALLR